MALVLKDRVKETSTTAGTGTITLAGAVSGFQSFSAVGNGNTTYYAIVDPTTGDWEVGLGTYTSSGTTLSRDTVLSSSNSGSLVNFAANAKDVFVTYPSEKSVYEDASNVVNATSFGAITATSAALTTGTVSTTPAAATDIANKQYVDTISASGIHYHEPVYVESPDTAGNLTATYNNGASGVGATLTNAGTQVALTIDGVLMTVGKRVLIYNQTNATQNGVYTVTTVGSGSTNWVLTRATDADTYSPYSPTALGQGDAFFVTNGLTGAGETYICNTVGTITFGTTNITFAQISDATLYTAGTGLTLTGTEFSITNTGVSATTYGSASAVPVIAVNAQGQITSATNTNIAINGSQVSGNISGSAGSVANALTLGTYLTGGSFNGSSAVTATVDATSANTASKVVARDSSGNFSAGTITATLSGSATSATTATNVAGGAANQLVYQSGSGTTTFATAPSASNQVLDWNGSAFTWVAGTISGVPLGSNLNSLTAGTYLSGTAYNGSAAQTWTVDATSANTASKVVARDASGNFSAGTITAALSGNATTSSSCTGNSATATSSPLLSGLGSYVWSGSTLPTSYNLGIQCSFVDPSTWPSYGSVMTMNTYSGGGGALQMYVPYSPSLGGTGMQVRFGNYDVSSGNSWTSWKTLLASDNYNSYAPTLTGTGASGTWNINITGSAGSSGSSSSVSATTSTGIQNSYTAAINTTTPGLSAYGMVFSSQSTSDYASGLTWAYSGTSSQAGVYVQTSGAYGTRMYLATTDSFASGSKTALYINESGTIFTQRSYLQATGSLRAPIFYDSDNTSYFLNPYNPGGWALVTRGEIRFENNSGDTTHFNYSNGAANNYIRGTTYFDTGPTYITSNLYANIFYDYNDTAYYVDPASTSVINALNMNTAGTAVYRYLPPGTGTVSINAPFYWNALTGSINIAMIDNDTGGVVIDNEGVTVYGAGDTGGVFRVIDEDTWQTNGNNVSAATCFYVSQGTAGGWGRGDWEFYTSVRAPIFYDYNNTSYYLDPASSSVLNTIYQVGVYTRNSAGTGYLSGNYASSETSATTGAIYTIGGSYYPTSSSFNTMYGIGYCYAEGVGVGISGASGWGMYVNAGGVNNVWLGGNSGNVISTGDHRGTVFYDYNNTGYYLDPASSSYLYSLSLSGSAYFQPNSWIQLNGDYGLYWPNNYGAHFRPNTTSTYTQLMLQGSKNSYSGLYDYASGVNGFMYDSAGNGGVYREANGRWYFYHNVSNDCMGIGTSSTSSSFSLYLTKGVYAQSRIDATIYYDVNNTSYYADPASTSVFNDIYANGLYSYGNVTAYYSSDIKFKENVRNIPNAIETVESIGGKLFDWTDEYIEEHGGADGYFVQKADFGVIAQDVQKVFPVAVRTRPDGSLAVDYEKLSALAFAAVAELSTRVKSLEARM